ncbi:MAG: ABC transporter ATP-binding protein, partial [Bacteroidota bacterium]
ADEGYYTIDSERPKPIGAIIEKPALYEYLNAQNNLKTFSAVKGVSLGQDEICKKLIQVGLSPERRDPVRNYSLGMKQRLGIAIALLHDPEGLILDEPFLGLDPKGMADLSKLLRNLALEGNLMILLSSHLIDHLRVICDQFFVMKQGCIVQRGDLEEVMSAYPSKYFIGGTDLPSALRRRQVAHIEHGEGVVVEMTEEQVNQLIKDLIMEGKQINTLKSTAFDEMYVVE